MQLACQGLAWSPTKEDSMFSLKNISPSITDMIRFDHSHVVLTWH